MDEFDLVVLGTGPAASRVATKCASEDWKVAIVESREFGGTCALRGCIPKKVLVRAAELTDWARRADGKLTNSGDVAIDWAQLIAFKREFTEPVATKSEASFQDKGISTFSGSGKFAEPNVIAVGPQRLKTKRTFVAVGAKPAPIEIPGSEHIITSDEFMELEALPEQVLFIGGGYISFEFAHVAARAEAEVKIIDHGCPLTGFDPDLVRTLAIHSQQMGIRVLPNSEVTKIEKREDGGFTVAANIDGKVSSYSVGLLVHGAGRIPNLDGMELEAGNVDFGSEGIVVNEYLQSVSNSTVFAAGDCAASGKPMLTPAANQQARTIALNLLAGEMKHLPDYGQIPAAVFTVPSLAGVGMSEAEAFEKNLDFEIRAGDMSDWGSVRKLGGSAAAYKILVENKTDRILGAHLLGPHAAEAINIFAMAMKFNLTATDVKSLLFTFPTFTADIRSML